MNNLLNGFYFITDHRLSLNGSIKDVDLAIQAGVKVIQFREKLRERKYYYDELLEIKALCKDKAILIVNDSIELAKEINADGVHVGQKDISIAMCKKAFGEDKIIGISVSNINEALLAEDQGANYIGVGHVFPTRTKNKETPPIGIVALKEIKQRLSIPVVAIGGINLSNAKSVIDTGIDMMCAISDSLKGGAVKENIMKYLQLFHPTTFGNG